ncbi:MAG: 4-hydroxybutyrate CoA-transferase, partial [Bdellovibrionota bacterium]
MKLKNLDSVKNLIQKIQSGHRVFIQGGAGTPNVLIDELVAQANRLKDVELIHLHTIGPARYAEPSFKQNFRVANLFVGENLRSSVDYDQVDYLPCFLSENPQLFRSKRRPLNVSLVHLSPPDDPGYCTLG